MSVPGCTGRDRQGQERGLAAQHWAGVVLGTVQGAPALAAEGISSPCPGREMGSAAPAQVRGDQQPLPWAGNGISSPSLGSTRRGFLPTRPAQLCLWSLLLTRSLKRFYQQKLFSSFLSQ